MEIVILLVLCLLSGFFSASEVALFSLSSMKIKAYQTSQDLRKLLIAKLVLQPRDLLVTIFMLNTCVNILMQNVASHMFGNTASWLLKVGVPLVLMLLFGEIAPKYIGIQNNVSLAYLVAPSISFLQNLLSPLRKLIIAITTPLSRIMFFFLKKEDSISKEELQHVLKKSEEYGVLNRDEAELVWGYLHLQDISVKEAMRPREDILFYDLNEPLKKLINLFVDLECSRVPVCDKTIENVLGIMSAKDYFLQSEELKNPKDLEPHLKKPFFVPETTPARLLLRKLEESNQEIAIIVDEYGSISGLVTYEDLVEVVVGNIVDLRDQKSLYTRAGNHEIIASGKLELAEFNEIFGVEFKSANNLLTIGGWLTEQLGEIPKAGKKYETGDFLFHVLGADPNRIRRLYIRKGKS